MRLKRRGKHMKSKKGGKRAVEEENEGSFAVGPNLLDFLDPKFNHSS